jgi:alkanesulfonate monooxygenase SsuD/methylene tetrahydromethanopterin reductase-like flavin-dependent oxidoreductase (luciferase family)
MGSPDDVIEWIDRFSDLGVETFIIRFGAFDQRKQLERFADDVMPSFLSRPRSNPTHHLPSTPQ